MKRYNNLIPLILDKENLYLAYWKARRGKEAKTEVRLFADRLEENITGLQRQIAGGEAPDCDYQRFTIRDPKERLICAAPFPSRVLHHALMNVCGPLFDKRLIPDSYASRPGKGTYAALERARQYHRRHAYCVKMDVRKYFDSIDHSVLKRQLTAMFKEPGLLRIFYGIIDGYETAPGKGLPIGNLTSQYFANHYLCRLDHHAKEELRADGYVRYMDDILLYGDDKAALMALAKRLREYLRDNLRLELKVLNIRRTSQTTQFLGYRLTDSELLLSRRSIKRYKQRLAEYFRKYDEGIWSEDDLKRHLLPLTAFVQKAKCREVKRQAIHNAV